MQKRNKDMDKLDDVMQKLTDEIALDKKHYDHALRGNFKDRRECHIEPDWLLVYKLDKKEKSIIFERTSSHADLFE
jgi:mRNA interferase YafQ